jgi:hypothetical protein
MSPNAFNASQIWVEILYSPFHLRRIGRFNTPLSCVTIVNTFNFQCPMNSYCSSSGICIPTPSNDKKSTPCSMDPQNTCESSGLTCISKKCDVCKSGQTTTGITIETIKTLKIRPISKRSPMIQIHAFCQNGQWSVSSWNISNNVELIISICIILTVALFCFIYFVSNIFDFLIL